MCTFCLRVEVRSPIACAISSLRRLRRDSPDTLSLLPRTQTRFGSVASACEASLKRACCFLSVPLSHIFFSFPTVAVVPEKPHLCPPPLPLPRPAPLGYVNSCPGVWLCTISSVHPLSLQLVIHLVLFECSQCQAQRGLCGSRTPRNLCLSPSAFLKIV